MLKRFTLAIALLVLSTSALMAQMTTSGIVGKITDANGEPIVGAVVKATHEPSGTFYSTATNVEGRYTIAGMRVGGPYTVEINYIGYADDVKSNLYLQLGEDLRVNSSMKEDAVMLGEVVITGKTDAGKTGAGMNIGSAQLSEIPSLNHNVGDFVRITPQATVTESGAMMFAGANNRYNSFQIDGAMNNDVFGLTANGSNGGQAGANPVSMETVDQLQVAVAPFDVRQSGFTGGSINAVTKSGTNQFHASVYTYLQNKSFIGKKYQLVDGTDSGELGSQHDNIFGATIGGPIVKNKLFFFASYERSDKAYDNIYGPGSKVSKVDGTLAQACLDYVIKEAKAQGYDYAASLGTPKEYTQSHKASVKLDWNINDKHKATFRWSLVSGKQLNQTASAGTLVADSYAYDFITNTNTFTAELNSRFNDKVSNELHLSYVRVRDHRQPGIAMPMIQVGNVGSGTLCLGNERSSMANALNQDIYTLTDNLSFYLDNHTLTVGTHNEIYRFGNLFLQDFYGTYYFSGGPVMENGVVTSLGTMTQFRFGMANTDLTGDPRWFARFTAGQFGFYLQDKWNVTDRFNLTYGARIDIPVMFDTPAENVRFNKDAELNGWNMKTNNKISSMPMVSPRIGFRYDLSKESNQSVVLRGGLGVFTGRVPFVWISNNFSNTGVMTVSYNTGSNSKGVDKQFILNPDPMKQIVNAPISKDAQGKYLIQRSAQTINAFDKNFRYPQTLRANLALDARFLGIDWTFEALWAGNINDMLVQNLNITETGKTLCEQYGLDASRYGDNRPMFQRGGFAMETYDDDKSKQYSGIYYLTNTSKGHTVSLSAKAEKSFNFGLDVAASYTYTDSRTVNNGSSSVAASNWQYNYTYTNPNDPEVARSSFCFPHSIVASVYYHLNWPGSSKIKNTTTFGLLYQGTSGTPYSVYMYNDMNGDGGTNDLMYIPTDKEIDYLYEKGMFFAGDSKTKAKYTPEEQVANYKQWLASEKYIKDHRGQYFERNAANQDFVHRFDFHIDHKFGFRVASQMHYLTVGFDILNVGNLFNKKWGRTYGSTSYYQPVTWQSGKLYFDKPGDFNMRSYSDYYSRWRGQLSVKYSF